MTGSVASNLEADRDGAAFDGFRMVSVAPGVRILDIYRGKPHDSTSTTRSERGSLCVWIVWR